MYFVCSPSLCGVLVFDSVSRLRLLLRHAPFHSHATLSHTIFHHTIFHTQPCTPSFTHHLCGTCTPSLRQAWHLSTAVLCVAGVAIGDIHLRFAWQAWHLVTSTFVLRGRHGTYGTGLALVARLGALGRASVRLGALGRAWARLVAGDAAVLCVAGVALGDIHLRFAWQAWHLPLMALGWLWCRACPRLGALGHAWSPVTPRYFVWQAAWHLVTSTFASRGRRGTWWHPPSFCVAGVALT